MAHSFKNGIQYADVISRHQPHVLKGNRVDSTHHGKDLHPRKYGVEDLRRECDKSDMGTNGREKLFPEDLKYPKV